MKPWRNVTSPDDVDIVAPDGLVRSRVKAYYSGKQFIIDDMSVDVRPDDEIRRLLPNGREETFVVTDPKYYSDGPFGPHYQVAIVRRGVFDRRTGGHYTINVSGPNSRVNLGSTDNSTNTAVTETEDLATLSNELARLREAIASKANTPEHYIAMGAVAAAELAAKEGDAPKVSGALSSLGSAGSWVLDTARAIGVPLVVVALRQYLGLPPG